MSGFVNEPTLELRRGPQRAALQDALTRLDARLPLDVPLWVADDRAQGEEIVSTDPGTPARVVARAPAADAGAVERAVAVAAGSDWPARPAGERAAVLRAAAALLRERRLELAALEVRECAKPWREADGDVCEAIDFLEYYAHGAVELDRGRALEQLPGERNSMRYRPRGVAAVIAPWNFPIAIPAGMTAAALATGNAVLLKPAEQSPGCAFELVRAMREAGVPQDALALLPGAGETGRRLVEHAGVGLVAFTGSAAVGLEIIAAAARPGAQHIKQVVAEMGGKNCVIVDADADLDEVVPGIVASAFGYGGQKCSAAARVLAHEAIAEPLTERLAGAIELLVVGQAEDFATDVPPLIERAAQQRVRRYAALAAEQGLIVAGGGSGLGGDSGSGGGGAPPEQGWFCTPTLAAELPGDSALLREEIFGPLLTIEACADVASACERVAELPFALTGGLYSRNPRVVAEVIARSPVGNLYVNRPITGAMVGRQPFGGNRLSGTGTKAGGPDYLLAFVQPIVVSENTTRHGLEVE